MELLFGWIARILSAVRPTSFGQSVLVFGLGWEGLSVVVAVDVVFVGLEIVILVKGRTTHFDVGEGAAMIGCGVAGSNGDFGYIVIGRGGVRFDLGEVAFVGCHYLGCAFGQAGFEAGLFVEFGGGAAVVGWVGFGGAPFAFAGG